jgi:hypothetical protein
MVWSNGLIPGDNVVGNNNVLETVKLGYFSAAETLATDNQNGVVVFGQSGHGRMRLNELLRRDRRPKNRR